MSILFGHPTGNPNSHHAALAHFETGRLEAFCIPWMPAPATLNVLESIPRLRPMAQRLGRRHFPPLAEAPKIQGRIGEWRRLAIRALGRGDEALSYEANDWLMRTMQRECRRTNATAVHAYEDCSLWQFEEAKRRGKACLYDMPIGYYPWWEEKQIKLAQQYSDWLPPGGFQFNRFARPDQKCKEMDLADLALAPSRFVENTIRQFHPDKKIAFAPYGVDLGFWSQQSATLRCLPSQKLRFLYVGQIGIRKGIPVLIEAWSKAGLKDAELHLVGAWQLSAEKQTALPLGVKYSPPCSREALREHYRAADVFVFPSFFEGFALAVLEAMACGLPVITTEVLAGMNLVTEKNGLIFTAGEVSQLTDALHGMANRRDRLSEMKDAARSAVEQFTWEHYRRAVSVAVAPFI